MKIAALLALLCLSGVGTTCAWDRDTLAQEAAGKMDLVAVIVGRFDRNPPLYYKMRLDRCIQALEKDPTRLDLYDDASVACDRLGNSGDALAGIEKKHDQLSKQGNPMRLKEHWYRYHANAGTFWAHRWARSGAKANQLSEIDKAIRHIELAIEINPDAHFGREFAQLEVLKWIRKVKSSSLTTSIDDEQSLSNHFAKMRSEPNMRAKKISTGIAGLIRLGAGLESVDLFSALATSLCLQRDSSIGALALFRANELIRSGKRSLSPFESNEVRKPSSLQFFRSEVDADWLFAEFNRLRNESESWHKRRTEFMNARLEAGRHPDWDANFWKGWNDGPALKVRELPFFRQPAFLANAPIWGITAIILGIPVLAIWLKVRSKNVNAKNRKSVES